jgi:16S rRNA (cytosine967-C5)-methyltransferase
MMERKKAQGSDLTHELAKSSRLQGLLLDLWQRTRMDWGFVTDRLQAAFRAERSLAGDERRTVAETLYGMVRYLRRLDAALGLGGFRAAGQAPDRARLLAYLVLEAGLSPADAAQQFAGVDWSAVAGADERLAAERDPVQRIALRHSYPDWLAALFVDQYGDEAEALAAALNERAPMTIRVNTLAAGVDEVAAALADEGIETHRGRYGSAALVVDTRTNIFGLRAFKRGLFEAMDEGSQLVAELVAPPPRPIVVDYCAGAGGKSLAVAAMMQSRGRLVASDIDERKLRELRRRARRAGVSNLQAVALEAEDVFPPALERIDRSADRVLVDAPCSGVGALRRNPEARWRLQAHDLDRLPAQQLAIAERAAALVKPGGRLVYATCTILEAENQRVVDRFLERHPTFERMPVKAIWGAERANQVGDGTYLKVVPQRHGTDGFFAAVLRRTQ